MSACWLYGISGARLETFLQLTCMQLRGSAATMAALYSAGILVAGGTHPQPHNEDFGLEFQRTDLSCPRVDIAYTAPDLPIHAC